MSEVPEPLEVSYCPVNDELTVNGLRYAGDLFRYFSLETPPGRWMRIYKRDDDGNVTVQLRYEDPVTPLD